MKSNTQLLATKTLPPGAFERMRLDLPNQPRLTIWLFAASLVLLVVFGILFLALAAWVHPGERIFAGPVSLAYLAGVLAAYLAALVLHELIHGLFFWIITRDRPRFGIKGAYAYASAPHWYIRRNPFLVIGMAPFVLITLGGILLIPVLNGTWLTMLLVALVTNASGAVGDLYTVGWLLAQRSEVWVQDAGDVFVVYGF